MPGTAAAPSRSLHIPSLDGIRACAVLLVFAAHALAQAGVTGVLPGEFGVTTFFFLSGYLITTLLRLEHEQSGAISFRAFYLRRVVRIFPPFYLALIIATLLWLVGGLPQGPAFELDGVAWQALFATNYWVILHGWWTGLAPGTWIFWSLAVEEHFYLAFPLVYVLLLRFVRGRARQALILAGLCGVVLAWRLVLVLAFGAGKDRTYVATDTRIDSILFGCILGIVANPVLGPTRLDHRAWKFVLVPLALVGLLVSFVIRDAWFQETVAYTLQGICLFPLFIAAVRFPLWGPFELLNLAPVKFIGVVSYSIYLVHPSVLYGISHWAARLPSVAQDALALALTIGIAYGIYVAVERPAARLRKRLSRALVPERPAVPAAPPTPAVVAAGRAGS
ncbi:MAG: acyltransferase [Chloroflexi bacterium]|nr:MAG: acyltransferase [Chloroflexota bacterium]